MRVSFILITLKILLYCILISLKKILTELSIQQLCENLLSHKVSNAGDRNRTGTVSPQQDFKSCASACSATPAYHKQACEVGPIGLEPMTLCL